MPAAITAKPGRPPARLDGPTPVVLLLVCHVALGLSAVRNKSLTFDEGVHLTGGMSYWATNDYRLHPENGNWSQRWAALPTWLAGDNWEPRGGEAWRDASLWDSSDHFLYDAGNDADAMLWRGRLAMAVPSALLGLVVYLWSRRLWGAGGGLVSLTAYAFSPAMLANGFLTTSDLFAALFFNLAVAALWRLLHLVTPGTVTLATLAVAGLLLSKFSGVLIAPMAVVMLGVRLANAQPVHVRCGKYSRDVKSMGAELLLFAGVALTMILGLALVIWTSYGFRYSAFAPPAIEGSRFQVGWDDVVENLPPTMRAAVDRARAWHLLPEAHLFGFCFTLFTGARLSFLNGASSTLGWTGFFPYCLLVKTPLAFFALLGLALGGWRWRQPTTTAAAPAQVTTGDPAVTLYALTPLCVLFGVYWVFAMQSALNIGHRHILPTYPPLFVFAGAAAWWFRPAKVTAAKGSREERTRAIATAAPRLLVALRILVGTTLAVLVFDAVATWPHYLAYFNRLAGGPAHAYRHLIDSSLDWGQDLKGLGEWVSVHPEFAMPPDRTYLAYFGMARPGQYGLKARALPGFRVRWEPHVPHRLTGGLYCISASMLQSAYLLFPGRWNKTYEAGYQQLRSEMEEAIRSGVDLAGFTRATPHLSPEELQAAFRNYEDLRFGRLVSFLRMREPDAEVGYSILIYRLSDADVAQALDGPPVELLDKPETVD